MSSKKRNRGKDKKNPEITISTLDLIDAAAWLIFGGLAIKLAKKMRFESAIRKAGLSVHPHVYAARTLFFTLLSVIGVLASVSLVIVLVPDIVLAIVIIVALSLVPLITFSIFVFYPSLKMGSRAKEVENELPFFAAYLTTMAYSGVSPEKVIETIANLKLFKGIRKEAERILRDIKLFGKDPLTAIDDIAIDHPSMLFREFMLGYTTTIRTGGDVIHYLELRTQDLFRRRVEDLKALSERIGLVVEMFIALNVVLALSFYVFFVISSILPAGGFGGLSLFLLFTLFIQPMITIALLFMVDAMIPRDPVWDKTVYAYLFITLPVGLLIGFLSFAALGGYELLLGMELTPKHVYAMIASTSAALLIGSLGGVKGYLEKRAIEHDLGVQLANFLRDLTETRKTGISIEKCIIYLSQRDYGILTHILKRIAGALLVGIDIIRAIRRAVKGLIQWLALIVFKFLIDAIEYGGATPQVLDTLSRYVNELVTMREELRRRLKSYIAVPYFGAILIAFTSLLVLGMIAQSIHMVFTGPTTVSPTAMGIKIRLSPQDLALISTATSIGGIINSWLMGLMCGKLRDLTILSGFLHSVILVV
ncbi:MAG TPA: hypothetical protein ENF93_01755, partial [Ignisphaera sp.]|nr:hypothetical protein [Ignisphaera sp.]